MKTNISFIILNLLFSASLTALAETTKLKEFPTVNLIGNKDKFSTPLLYYVKGNNKYTLTPDTAGVQITPPIVQIEKDISYADIGIGCVPSIKLNSETYAFICESKRIQEISISFNETTKKYDWKKVNEAVDLEALLKKKAPTTFQLGQKPVPVDNSKYECNNMISGINGSNRDQYLIVCYRTNGEKESLVQVIFNYKKKIIEARYDFENKAESKTPKLFTAKILSDYISTPIVAIYNLMPESSGVLKLYKTSQDNIPKIENEKIIVPNKITGVDPAFTLSSISTNFNRKSQKVKPNIVLAGTKPEAMLLYSFSFDTNDLSKLTPENSHITLLPKEKYGTTFGASVEFNLYRLIFVGKNSYQFTYIISDGSLKVDEKQLKQLRNREIFYNCSESTKENEVFPSLFELGKFNWVKYLTKDGKTQSRGVALFSRSNGEVYCKGDLKSDFFIKARKPVTGFGFRMDDSTAVIFTSKDNKYSTWEDRFLHRLDVDASKLTTGTKTLKLKVENQNTTGGPAAVEFDIKIGKSNDIASSEAVINVPAKSVNIFPGEMIKIPVGIKNAYGNNLNFKVEAKGAKSAIVIYNNKKTLSIPKSGTTELTGKFNSFIPLGNDYFLQSQSENYKVGTHLIYQCNVLESTQSQATCKFISKFSLAKELILRKAFVLKDRILLIMTRIDFSRYILASLNMAKPPTTEISKDLGAVGIKEVFKKDEELINFKVLIEKSDQALIWWSSTERNNENSRQRGRNFIER